jgi:hypothetical protein
MQMSNQKHSRWILPVRIALVFIVTTLLAPVLPGAEQNPPEKTSPAAEVSQPQPTPPEPETEASNQQQAGQQSPDETVTPPKPVKPFNPSETIGADSAVSFPIDI